MFNISLNDVVFIPRVLLISKGGSTYRKAYKIYKPHPPKGEK